MKIDLCWREALHSKSLPFSWDSSHPMLGWSRDTETILRDHSVRDHWPGHPCSRAAGWSGGFLLSLHCNSSSPSASFSIFNSPTDVSFSFSKALLWHKWYTKTLHTIQKHSTVNFQHANFHVRVVESWGIKPVMHSPWVSAKCFYFISRNVYTQEHKHMS